MTDVSVRELRNHGGRVVDRVLRGESVIVTRSGRPVAELRPLAPRALPAETLLARWRALPAVNPEKLKADVDAILDPSW